MGLPWGSSRPVGIAMDPGEMLHGQHVLRGDRCTRRTRGLVDVVRQVGLGVVEVHLHAIPDLTSSPLAAWSDHDPHSSHRCSTTSQHHLRVGLAERFEWLEAEPQPGGERHGQGEGAEGLIEAEAALAQRRGGWGLPGIQRSKHGPIGALMASCRRQQAETPGELPHPPKLIAMGRFVLSCF